MIFDKNRRDTVGQVCVILFSNLTYRWCWCVNSQDQYCQYQTEMDDVQIRFQFCFIVEQGFQFLDVRYFNFIYFQILQISLLFYIVWKSFPLIVPPAFMIVDTVHGAIFCLLHHSFFDSLLLSTFLPGRWLTYSWSCKILVHLINQYIYCLYFVLVFPYFLLNPTISIKILTKLELKQNLRLNEFNLFQNVK